MALFTDNELKEYEVPAARDLFDRIIAAESERLTEEQRANPRAYLLATWHEAAEAVMRPIQSRVALERELESLRGPVDPFSRGLGD